MHFALVSVLLASLSVMGLATPSSNAAARSLVKNGTFENGTAGWQASPTGSLVRLGQAHSGSYSVRVENTATTAATTVLNDAVNTVQSTSAGAGYVAKAWVRTAVPDITVDLRLMEYKNSTLLGKAERHVWLRDTHWHLLQVQYSAVSSGAEIDLNVLGWDVRPDASFDVDDVSLTAAANRTGGSERATGVTSIPAPKDTVVGRSDSSRQQATSAAADRIFPKMGTGALFGYYQSGSADVRPMEGQIGRKFDVVHRYRDFNNASFIDHSDQLLASGGRTIEYTWESVSYDGKYDAGLLPAPAASADMPGGAKRKVWTYTQISNGSLDRYLDAVAKQIAQSPYDVMIGFNHEMDDSSALGGSNKQRAAAGNPKQFAAAYRHIIDRFRSNGVKNVAWTWGLSGWYADNVSKWPLLQQMWPGPGYIDVISWDPYNNSAKNWRSFGTIVSKVYNAVNNGMLDPVDPSAKGLRKGIAEYGSIKDDRRPAWLRSIPSELRKYPQIVTIDYFSSGAWGTLQGDKSSIAALAEAGKDRWLDTKR